MTAFTYARVILLALLLLIGGASRVSVRAQTLAPNTPAESAEDQEKAEAIIKRAVEALGGPAYLNVRNQIGRGFFSPYKDGESLPPLRFIDYIVYPDKERTEFTGSGGQPIQANLDGTGWLYDGAARTMKD